MLEEAIARAQRNYKRCGKLVLSFVDKTMLCSNCAPSNDPIDRCIVCDSDCQTSKFSGKLCKSCLPRKVNLILIVDIY